MRPAAFAALLLAAACKPSDPTGGKTSTGFDRIQVIAEGGEYSVKDHIVPGHATVLYFFADW